MKNERTPKDKEFSHFFVSIQTFFNINNAIE